MNELQTLLDIKQHNLVGFPYLVDAGDCSHANTKGMYGNNHKFIIMKKLGINLFDIYDHNCSRLRMIDLLKLGISLVKLVERLHDIGIVHLDIKPDNIVVSQEKDQLTRGNTITNFKIKDLEELMEHDMR